MDTSQQAIQVRSRESKRRFRAVEEKRRIVEETLQLGASVARVARAHGVNANQVFGWRQLYRQGRLEPKGDEAPSLLPVRVRSGLPLSFYDPSYGFVIFLVSCLVLIWFSVGRYLQTP